MSALPEVLAVATTALSASAVLTASLHIWRSATELKQSAATSRAMAAQARLQVALYEQMVRELQEARLAGHGDEVNAEDLFKDRLASAVKNLESLAASPGDDAETRDRGINPQDESTL